MQFFWNFFFAAIFAGISATAFAQEKTPEPEPIILKANQVDANQETNIVTAHGNVEVVRGPSVMFSDKLSYDKNNKYITATGDIKARNIEVGKLRAQEAIIKDDFSNGTFFDSTLVLNNGSYLKSGRTDRKNKTITVLQKPIYALCPDENISRDDRLAGKQRDLLSLKSSEATINREENTIKIKHGFFRIYNIPVFYVPYAKFPLPDNKRRSGFLSPSYIKNTRFGIGLKTPYFIDLAPNADLTITPQYYLSKDQLTINNDFRHMTKKGAYNVNFEISNNKVDSTIDKTVVNRTTSPYRWHAVGQGKFEFNENASATYILNQVGDHNYLRDYNYNFAAYTLSNATFDYTEGRQFYGVQAINIQELVDTTTEKSAPLILPSFESYIESKPLLYKEKLALGTNITVIQRNSGLQYRRASLTPEVKAPYNIYGNLITLNARMQTDIYSLENNFTSTERTNDYSKAEINYKPEFSVSWRLPLIQKLKSNTLMVEPIVNFVSSTFHKNFTDVPNEDSNNSELTVNNLFINDRIAGYDRNESGQRFSYGVKSSMFNKYGQFGATLGQSYRLKDEAQDITIRGFNDNNKSNIVGEFSYKYKNYFNTTYAFQLNESNYKNDVNSVSASLSLERFSFSTNYLLLRKTITNAQEVQQISGSGTFKVNEKWSVGLSLVQDIVIKRTISRGVNINYGGCCVIFTFAATENNSTNLIKPQTSYKINVTIKNI